MASSVVQGSVCRISPLDRRRRRRCAGTSVDVARESRSGSVSSRAVVQIDICIDLVIALRCVRRPVRAYHVYVARQMLWQLGERERKGSGSSRLHVAVHLLGLWRHAYGPESFMNYMTDFRGLWSLP